MYKRAVWSWIPVPAFLLVAAIAAISAIRSARARWRRYADAAELWHSTPDPQRVQALARLADGGEPNGPAWYLIGCAHLREYRTKQAARAFGIAQHADCNLETSALLAFACLKAADGEDSDIVDQIIATWHEMNRPDILRRKEDRLMLACIEPAGDLPDLPPLGRLAWLVVGPALRPQVRQHLAEPRADEHPRQLP